MTIAVDRAYAVTDWSDAGVREMRKPLLAAISLLLVAPLLAPAGAAVQKQKYRVVEAEYNGPVIHVLGGRVCDAPRGVGCIYIAREPGDKYVQIEVEDASRQEVAVMVDTGYPRPRGEQAVLGFCTKSGRFPVHPKQDHIIVFIYQGNLPHEYPSGSELCRDKRPFATRGVIRASFSATAR